MSERSILNLAVGDWVRLRNRDVAKVISRRGKHLELSVAALNGFGGVLWWEPSFFVDDETGMPSKYPNGYDAQYIAKIRQGWWSYSITDVPIGKVSISEQSA